MSIRIGIGIKPSAASGPPIPRYDPDIETYIGGLVTPLSTGQLALLEAFVVGLKADLGITSLSEFFDAMYILANETSEAALRNLVKRSSDAIPIAGPTFTVLEGFAGDGIGAYIDTNFIPSTQAIRYAVDDLSFGAYSRTNPGVAAAVSLMGCFSGDNGSYLAIQQRVTISTEKLRFLGQGITRDYKFNWTAGDGMLIGTNDATVVYGYRNKIHLGSDAGTAATLPTKSIFLLASRSGAAGDTPGSFSTSNIAFAFFSKMATQGNIDAITDRFETYMDANGKGVIP